MQPKAIDTMGANRNWMWMAVIAFCLAAQSTAYAQEKPHNPIDLRNRTLTTGVSAPIPIQPGDVLSVDVFSTPELSAPKVRVGEDGEIGLPMIGGINVAGLTSLEASQLIAQTLHDTGTMLKPNVTVFVTEYATAGIKVLGEVRVPGTYLLLGQHSLYDALSAAGGVTHDQGSSITISHANDPTRPEVVPITSPNYSQIERMTTVRPGDVIVVARAEAIYVVGDVGHPGEFFVDNGRQLTVLNVLALAQGLNPTAASTKASIIRPTADGKAITIKLDIKQIQRNQALNAVLQPSDVLVIPRSGLKQFLSYSIPNATSAVVGSVAAALVVR